MQEPARLAKGRATILCICCMLVLAITLWAGLSPFRAPKNQVRWLPNRDGLAFGENGTALTRGMIQPMRTGSISIEIWLKSARGWDSGTILSLYSPQEPNQFLLCESVSDLMVRTSTKDRTSKSKLYINNVFGHAPAVFLTITADSNDTRVYQNGRFLKTFPGFRAAADLRPFWLVLGTEPKDANSWRGEIYGLALYNSKLNSAQVTNHFQSWKQNGHSIISEKDKPLLLYRFDEHSGAVVHNSIGKSVDLILPERFATLDQVFLKPAWLEYREGADTPKNILINICGFIPLGFCFCACWAHHYSLRAAAWRTIALGAAVTLTIEIVQAFLPTRHSGTTDLFTNTLGTCIGAALYCLTPTRMLLERTLDRLFRRDI